MITTREFANAAGISFRQADYWARADIIRPAEGPTTPGSGNYRTWTASEIRVARAVASIMKPGHRGPDAARTIAAILRDQPDHAWTGSVFVDPVTGTVSRHARHGCIVIDLDVCAVSAAVGLSRILADRERLGYDPDRPHSPQWTAAV